jgi:hypothetical protein
MMPYQSYLIYQAERPKTAAEIRRADEQLGHVAANVSWLWRRATRPIAALRGTSQRPACSTLLDVPR